MNELAFRPNTLGIKFVRERVAVHTPFMTPGVAFKIMANLLHKADGC